MPGTFLSRTHMVRFPNLAHVSLTLVGVAFRDLKGSLYPTVGMRTAGEIVEANFGQRDFVFDIESYVKVGHFNIADLEFSLLHNTITDTCIRTS